MSWHENILRTLPDYLAVADPKERRQAVRNHLDAVYAYAVQDGIIDPDEGKFYCSECQDVCECGPDCDCYESCDCEACV